MAPLRIRLLSVRTRSHPPPTHAPLEDPSLATSLAKRILRDPFSQLNWVRGLLYCHQMKTFRSFALVGFAVVCSTTLTGCSIDSLIWGTEGARVIGTTENLIQDLAKDGTTDLVCADAQVDLGTPNDWDGLSAGEPERFAAEYWEAQVPLDPQWSINLEGLPSGATPGNQHPGDVFYRETKDGLCVIDVAWWTLVDEG